jgi:hypothetical protein
MSRTVCGTCWAPYIEGKCECETAPPKPLERTLTDEVIADLWHKNGGFHHHFARAVERWLKGQS